ncbi:MAG TPA: outer membrane beta-barrel protein [Legionellaceae bacterium]|nr:outer membrane beta-barrel protein [Legionellaceae bacterium]
MNKSWMIITSLMITSGLIELVYADNDFSHHSRLNSWTGLYAGVDAGVLFDKVQLSSQQLGFTNPSGHCNISSDFSTFFPGIQLGYMHQFPNYFVSGIEANVTFNTRQNDALNCNCPINSEVVDGFSFRNQMQNAIKGRAGRAWQWDNLVFLPYITAGLSFAHVGLTYTNEAGDYYSTNTTQTGGLIGAGIEWAIRQHWSLRAEYSYADYGKIIQMNLPSVYDLIDPNGKASVNLSSNNVTISINYWI